MDSILFKILLTLKDFKQARTVKDNRTVTNVHTKQIL